MLKNIFFVFLFSFSALLHAEEKGYDTLSPPQPVKNPAKVEVIEFFWYGCPHCYNLEPYLNKWLENKPANVEFIRQPAAFSKVWADHAKAYYVAETLGVVDKLHGDLFEVIQKDPQKSLRTDEQLLAFFTAKGVDKAKVEEAIGSFMVDTKVRQAKVTPARYGLTGVPALIVNGKYKITGRLAGSHENMITVLEKLIAEETKAANK
ncbi:MAG: thioredoxin domain-containing protein [Methylococcaceae bacterium]|nr:thioredoxin domain-containing protein [Methylococcaceae bacterium]